MQAATRPMASTIRTEHPCGRHLAWNDDATIAAWHLLAAWCPDIGPVKQTSQNAYPVFNGALEDTRPSPDFWLSWGGSVGGQRGSLGPLLNHSLGGGLGLNPASHPPIPASHPSIPASHPPNPASHPARPPVAGPPLWTHGISGHPPWDPPLESLWVSLKHITVEFLTVGRASRSPGASYTSSRFLALGRDTLETLTSSFPSSEEARTLVEIESRG